jgi:hypothetical protein
MKTQHATTAEWKIKTCQENGIFLDSFYITAEDNTWDDLERIVCRFPTGTGQYGEPGRINLANARLIAAAPQMLAALRAALEAMGDSYDATDAAGEEGDALWDQVAEAIAKAEGRTE